MLLIEYPKCTTCKKAKKFLDDCNIKYETRNIVTNNPTSDELKNWIKKASIDIHKFFNTSGLKYRELNLKNQLKTMDFEEKIKLLSSDGMLVKRPILITNDNVLIGFNKEKYAEIIKKINI